MLAFVRSLEGSWGIYAMNADGSDERCLTRHGQPVAYPEWSPDGSQIAFHKHQSDAVWSPEGTRIAFASNRDTGAPFDTDIYIMNADGTDQQRIAAKAGDEWGIDWRKTD
jgi:Tol biopolymer transport system component